MMHEMYAVTALPADKIKNQWDIFASSPPVPGANEDLEVDRRHQGREQLHVPELEAR